jgi:hypothetical protein
VRQPILVDDQDRLAVIILGVLLVTLAAGAALAAILLLI